MEVSVGIQFSARELKLETNESAEHVRNLVQQAFQNQDKLLWLVDKNGKQVAVPLDKLAYVEVDAEASDKKVGFGRND
jgi:hypothetical protein